MRHVQREKALKRQVRESVDQRSNVLRGCSGCSLWAVVADSANNIDVTTDELHSLSLLCRVCKQGLSSCTFFIWRNRMMLNLIKDEMCFIQLVKN